MATNVAQRERSNIKCYVSVFNNINNSMGDVIGFKC